MRIVFMGSPEFAVPGLEALHASHHTVSAVITQPDRPRGRGLHPLPPPIKLIAQAKGIPVFQPSTTRTPEFVNQVQSFRPDVLVVVAYGEILRRSLLQVPPLGAVNLHASLLPKYRGAAPVAWAILRGESETGVTTMLMNEAMDAGPILLQASTSITPTETTETLTRKLAHLGAPLLRRTLDLMEKKAIEPVPQDESTVSFAPKLKKEDGWINWNLDAATISRQIRAFLPWPGSFSNLKRLLVKFWLAHPVPEPAVQDPGTVVRLEKHAILIACGQHTVLKVLELQPQNRPRLSSGDFLSGYLIQEGDRFVSDGIMRESQGNAGNFPDSG
jgi:methionyl-tRNA formyltransferase